jgi:uncharacterized protein YjbI with pentapeptide repeats
MSKWAKMFRWAVAAAGLALGVAVGFLALEWWRKTSDWHPLVTVVGVALVTALWWLWWRLPKLQADGVPLQYRDAKERADLEDSFRKTIGQALGGAAVLIVAGFAYYQILLTSKTSLHMLIGQQVSKGFEQLGSDKITIRLGGIYALEGVMNNSEQYQQPVLNALCAFVREGNKSVVTTAKPATEVPPLPSDIQAAVMVIGRRSNKKDYVDLSQANVPKALLSKADLSYADLSSINLSEANLAEADLSEANLSMANLSKAILPAADLSEAELAEANLSRADFSKAMLSKANLFKVDLSGAELESAYLSKANLSHANLRGAGLRHAMLFRVDLSEADLSGASLQGAELLEVNLSGANLSGAVVSLEQLNDACGDAETKLPPGLTIKPCPK